MGGMHSAITVCLVSEARQGPFVFHDGLEDGCVRAAQHGFDAIEIFPPSPTALDIAQVQGLLDHHGLKVAAIGTGGGWVLHKWTLTHPDSEIRAHARDFIRATIDLAGGFGAPAILGSMQGRYDAPVAREQALAWLADALEDLGEHARQHHVPFLYEPLNRYETNLFNRQGEAADWLGTLKTRNIRLLCDLFHMAIEEADLAAALRKCGPLVGHVHFADSNRRAMGLGHTDAAPIVKALRDIGYNGYLSAEILPLPDAETAARTTSESIRRLAALQPITPGSAD
jgi:sugar phosphate isomerase/epimerase